MVNREELFELVPHYVAMLVIVLVVINGLRLTVGVLPLLVEFVLIFALVLAYRPLVKRIDAVPTPTLWEDET